MFYPKLRNLILILIVCLLPIKSALADLQKGKDAYERGDYETAIKEWLPLAKGGNAEAQYELSLVYSYRFAIHKAAVKWLHKSAEQDYAEAQTTLGYWYRMGRGVVQDNEEAVKWHLKAAKQGSLFSQYDLGAIYESGEGTVRDYSQARKWYRKAAEQENNYDFPHARVTWAQHRLGEMYESGKGGSKSNREASKWYRKAAERGYYVAQIDLGRMYETGKYETLEGTVQNYNEGSKWYRKATESRDSFNGQAFWDLAKMYDEGEKVIQDYARAHMWYNLAVAQGYTLGQVYRNILAEKMTPAQIAEAQRLAREWQKRE